MIHFDEAAGLRTDWQVYLGTWEVYHVRLTKKLRHKGMQKIIPVTPELDRELCNHFLEVYFAEKGREYPRLADRRISHASMRQEPTMASQMIPHAAM